MSNSCGNLKGKYEKGNTETNLEVTYALGNLSNSLYQQRLTKQSLYLENPLLYKHKR